KFDPLRQIRRGIGKQRRFSREIRPSPPILLVGGGGWQRAIVLDVRAFFLPSANWMAWRKEGWQCLSAVAVCCVEAWTSSFLGSLFIPSKNPCYVHKLYIAVKGNPQRQDKERVALGNVGRTHLGK